MQPTNARPPVSRESTALRLTFLSALVVSMFVLLVARLWFLQVMTGERYVARADSQSFRTVQVDAPRGDILDRNGVPIVDNRYAQVVSVRPDRMGDDETKARTIARLAHILSMTEEQVIERIEDPRVGPFANRPIAIDVPTDVILYIHQNSASRFPGVIAERIPLREYPRGPLAAHVVGYTGQISADELEQPEYADYDSGDIIGWAGVEKTYESWLRGTDGERQVRVNARGEILEEVAEEAQAIPGNSVQLTIDAEAQAAVEVALQEGIELARRTRDAEGRADGTFEAPAGAAVVLEPETGEVVAMASYPTYDPESFVGGISEAEWNRLQDDENHFPLINRAISASYPPGSVYKPISAAAALTYGFAAHDTYIGCPAEYAFGDAGNVYRNWNTVDEGSLNLAESLMRSCDTVYYALARRMFTEEVQSPEGQGYNERAFEAIASGAEPEIPFEYLSEMSRGWGLDQLTGIDLPGERDGVVPGREWRFDYWVNARDNYCYQAETAAQGSYARELYTELCNEGFLWRGGDAVNMSIGQGDLQTTPLQVANTFAAIANRGVIMTPHVVRAIIGPNGPVEQFEPEPLLTVPVAADDLAFIEQGLVMVTADEDGTAYKVFSDFPFEIAGKTGTAEQKPKQPFAWFAAYNTEEVAGERYVVVVMVEEGGGGSLIAAPIAERIFGDLFNILLRESPEEDAITVELEAGEVTD